MKNLKRFISAIIIITFMSSQSDYALADIANALPEGPSQQAGAPVTIVTKGNDMTITATTPAILNWDGHNIGSQNAVYYDLNGALLSRVTGGNPTQIDGGLSVTGGQLFLINSSGLTFGQGAQVNAPGLVASTMDISNSNFLSHNYDFFGGAGFGSVINNGSIKINAPGGFAALLGSNVQNNGSITTTAGTIALATGNEVTINLDAAGSISAVAIPTGQGLTSNPSNSANAILNSGTLNSNGGKIILTAQSLKGLFTNLINNQGIIEANSLSSQSGTVSLSASGGDINLADGSQIQDASITGVTTVSGDNVKLGAGVITSAGKVTVKATDQIINEAVGSAANITANTLALNAVNGIGSGAALNTNVTNLSAINSTSGVIDITNSGTVNATTVINNGGATGNDIILGTTTGDINVGTITAAGSGDVTLNSAGNIYAIDSNSLITANSLSMKAQNNIGSSVNRINLNVNNVSGISLAIGDIYLNSENDINLTNLQTTNGLIDVLSDGQINAENVVTGGGLAADTINLKTTYGDIDVGNVNAAGGAANVTLSAAGNVYGTNSNNLITGNNLSITTGITGSSPVGKVLTIGNGITIPQLNGSNQQVVITNQPGATSYNIYFLAYNTSTLQPIGTWQLVATVNATTGAKTIWTDPSAPVFGQVASYQAVIGPVAQTSNIGSTTNVINTNVNSITARARNVGDIYLNQAKAVTLSALSTSNGLINVTANGATSIGSITTGSGAGNSVTVKTTAGDINVGTVNAAAGMADVNLNSEGSITDNSGNSLITANNLNMIANNSIGSSLHRINLNVNNVSGISQAIGDIYLNSENAINLNNLQTTNGLIDVLSDGQITANNVVTGGGLAADSITLATSYGDIDVGNINASNGVGDVTLNSAGNVYGVNANNSIKGNNLTLNTGITGTAVGKVLTIGNGISIPPLSGSNQQVVITNQPGAATYNIYFLAYSTTTLKPIGTWQLVGTVSASNGAKTIWTDPSAPVTGQVASYQAVVGPVAETSNIGTSATLINTNVNSITGNAQNVGNIYLNQAKAVVLSNLQTNAGLINVNAAGPITAQNVTTGGGASDSINLTTTSGNIDVGNLNAAGGLADVNLSSAASITNNSGDGLVTANNFNFTSGNVVGTQATVNPSVVGGNFILNIQNSGGVASYTIYGSSTLGGALSPVVTIPASSGASTQWVGPSIATSPSAYFVVKIASAATSGVGTSSNAINTNVNTINGHANNGASSGIYLKQGSNAVNLNQLNTATGPINVTSGGNISVGAVNAANGLGNIDLNSTNGSILNNNASSLVKGNVVSLTAANGIGLAGAIAGKALNTTANTINAAVTGTGLINVKNINTSSNGVTLSNVTNANGPITVSADGNMNVSTVNAGLGNVTLKATNNGSILDANSSVTGNVVTLTGAGGVGSSAKAINTQAKTLNAGSTSGLININQTGDVALGNVTTGGTAADSITVKGSGSIDTGTINAAGGLADVNLNAGTSITDNTGGLVTANNLTMVANNNIGTSANRINVNVNNVSGISQAIGDIYLNSENSINLTNLQTTNGLIDVLSDGQINAENVTTGGGSGDSISLATTFGDIDVGNINAAGGLGDVSLNSAGNIYANNSSSLITGNNLTLTAGINGTSPIGEVLTLVNGVSTAVVNGSQVVTIKNQPGATSYSIYYLAYSPTTLQPIGTWQLVATLPATNGSKTTWTDPSTPVLGQIASYQVVVGPVAQTSNIGTSSAPINTNVNTITGNAQNVGNIYLNQAKAVVLNNLQTNTGLINVNAAGSITAQNVTTGGGASDSINLTTTSGNIDVGNLNAAGGLADVNLSSAASITNNSGNGLVTANNFNFTSGSVVGTQAAVSPSVVSGNIVLNIQNKSGTAGYGIYSSTSPAGPYQLVATVPAGIGASTAWTGPAISGSANYFMVKVSSVSNSGVGTSSNPINTYVNTINGQANAGTASGIYLKQGAKAVTLSQLNAATGPINVNAGDSITAQNVTTGGGAADSINLTTTAGNIDVGNLNAAGGLADVNLSSAASITNNTGNGLVTANNFNFTLGNVVGTQATVSPTIFHGNILLNIQNTPGVASYGIYSSASPAGPYQLVATVPLATGSATTPWIGPVITGPGAYFMVKVASVSDSGVGTSSNPINTNVNTINGQANAGTANGVYLNQGAKAVVLGQLNAATGSINVTAAAGMSAENVSTGSGDINLTTTAGDIDAGNLNAAGGLSNVNLNSAGSITDNSGGLITANNLNVMAPNDIGTLTAPLNLDVVSVDGVSWNQGSVYLHTTGNIELGQHYFTPSTAEYTTTVLGANDGIVSVNADGNITVNSVITPNGGVSLVSNNGSIYAGVSADYANYVTNPPNPTTHTLKTSTIKLLGADSFNTSSFSTNGASVGPNVIAGGYSYFSAPKGTIGVATPGTPVAGVGTQLVGIVRPGITAENNGVPAPAVSVNDAPNGGVYYDDSSVFGASQLAPAAANTGNHEISGLGGSLPSMNNPLGVFIEVAPGSHSALPAGVTSPSGLSIGLSPYVGTSTPALVNGVVSNAAIAAIQDDNAIQPNQSVYYEKQRRHKNRPAEVAAPVSIIAYHATLDNNTSAISNTPVEPEAFDFIASRINANTQSSVISQAQAKAPKIQAQNKQDQ